MKKNKRGAHAAEPSKTKKNYFIFILFLIILIVILIGIYLKPTYIRSEDDDSQPATIVNTLELSDSHLIENSTNLLSKDLLIDNDNGIFKVKGTVENTSDDILKKLDVVYTLYDGSNNIVYNFEISISKLDAHSSSSFSSVCTTNLSNVVSYTVTLAK